ncbi:Acyl-CoA dehydrogenase [Cyclobacterium lianum]|uniref:Acyl-CoA dehydrogenase n=1 Tax=Cyclobacterium lianum TaxID=388280 RepID=A0A1M7HRK9_9BACT|nr:acyl-CoA dehydrogenase family protein [Cyclobacterium lianum]SHM31048.1 Acyl-CoA dehydrogenase [Cyclobacterium lianum]
MEPLTKNKALNGGEYLIRESAAADVFIPESFSEEQKMMAAASQEFLDREILPHMEEIDSMKNPDLVPQILKKAGELGLLAISVPETYGGLGMSFNTSMLIADIIGAAGSFSTTYGAHTGIGILPVLYYGTDQQKEKYLPKLSNAEWAACYCLTEPDAGSDANSGQTRAVLNEEGTHYLINGQKMWISNAGFADFFIVFAKVDDDKNLTAFLVEKTFGGISMNEEEKKMGIKGSSTRQVFFRDCPVPVGNMLSERGQGFKIAVNILNIGRIKLGAGVLGGCRRLLGLSIQYASERKQFGVPINSFGAIKAKLAEMAIKTYACESLCYRAGQDIEDRIAALEAAGMEASKAKLKGVEEFAIECAIAKVHGSEVLDFVADQGVQIFGGMGYSAEAPMERAYRDARISRIYEGTNEINRILMVGMLLKRAMKGELAIMDAGKQVGEELKAVPDFTSRDYSAPLSREKAILQNLKKVFLMIGGQAAKNLGDQLESEQEIMMHLADIMIEIYAAESTLLRTEKLLSEKGTEAVKTHLAASRVYLYEAVDKINVAGKEAIYAFTSGDEQKLLLMGLKRFTKTDAVNTKMLRREVADALIAEGRYFFFYA